MRVVYLLIGEEVLESHLGGGLVLRLLHACLELPLEVPHTKVALEVLLDVAGYKVKG